MTALSPTVRLDPSVLQSVPSSIIPSADNTYDLGSLANRWRDLWISNLIRLPNNNTIGVYINPSKFPWSGATDAIIIGHAGPGTTLILNDIDGAKWAIGTGGWDFTVAKQVVTSSEIRWSTAFYIDGGGSASSPPKRLVTMVPIIPSADNTYDLGSSTNRWRTVYVTKAVTGDVVFANGWRITEDGDALLFINPNGKPALKLKPDGTLERLLN